MRVVIDTNILVSALMSSENACRSVLRHCFEGCIVPLVGNALFTEYEDVLSREELFERGPFDQDKRNMFLDDFSSVCKWIDIQFLWRPNLYDEADNHVLELAVAGGAKLIITQNIKDFGRANLIFDDVEVIKPVDYLQKERARQWLQ